MWGIPYPIAASTISSVTSSLTGAIDPYQPAAAADTLNVVRSVCRGSDTLLSVTHIRVVLCTESLAMRTRNSQRVPEGSASVPC